MTSCGRAEVLPTQLLRGAGLPAWSETEIRRRVRAVNEPAVRGRHAGPGAVVALPHSGNWDLAGAWACATGMPVTTVAEQLSDAEYAAFVAFRESLGLEVVSHRDPGALTALIERYIADGSSACWRIGTFREPEYRCPGGGIPSPCQPVRRSLPAALEQPAARRLPIHRGRHGDHHWRADRAPPGEGWAGAMMQDVADFFADTIARQPEDWHMMQPFFSDREPAEEAR